MMLHISHSTWKILILLGAGLIMLMLAEVAAAREGPARAELRPTCPVEKVVGSTSDIRPAPCRV